MWYLRFKLKHKGCIYTPYTKKFGVVDLAYPLGHSVKANNIVHLSAIHILQGNSSGIKKYVKYLKKHKDILRIGGSGNVYFTKAKEKMYPEEYRAVYDPELIYVAPIINGKDGYELWQLASWDRAPLERLVTLSKSSPILIDFKLLEFRKKAIHDVYVASLLPKLSTKQSLALHFAYENGYYEFPKKTNLDKLAKQMKVTKATFQEHLKRAETKIIPFILQQKIVKEL